MFCFSGIYEGVRYFRNILFALAALLWLPMSAPCQWESILHFEFITCQCDYDAPDHQESACDHCPLCAAGHAQYTAGQAHQTIPLPPCQPLFPASLLNVVTMLSVFRTDRVEILKSPPLQSFQVHGNSFLARLYRRALLLSSPSRP